jgi:hypothetical protein
MQMTKFGKIAAIIGLASLLYGLILFIKIIPSISIFGVTAGGALDGAIAFFLAAIAMFLWPEDSVGVE